MKSLENTNKCTDWSLNMYFGVNNWNKMCRNKIKIAIASTTGVKWNLLQQHKLISPLSEMKPSSMHNIKTFIRQQGTENKKDFDIYMILDQKCGWDSNRVEK